MTPGETLKLQAGWLAAVTIASLVDSTTEQARDGNYHVASERNNHLKVQPLSKH